MRVIVRPYAEPDRELDLTDQLVSAIARELWRLYGGNDTLNWMEAERHLEGIIDGARSLAHATAVLMPHEPGHAVRPAREHATSPRSRRPRPAALSGTRTLSARPGHAAPKRGHTARAA